MKNKIKSAILTAAIAGVMVVTAACGQTAGKLTDDAASRAEDANSDVHYIDDNAIALAGEANTDNAKQVIDAAFKDVNKQREAAGLKDLTWNTGLEQCAKVRAQECTKSFSHTRPDGTDWWTVNSDLMYGENLAYNFDNADKLVAAWMASPAHKANIMNGEYTTVGMAVCPDGNGDWYWAQEFGY